MKAYGLPKSKDIEYPDLGDICKYGLKTAYLCPKRTANGDSKRRVRRYWKKKERKRIKNILNDQKNKRRKT